MSIIDNDDENGNSGEELRHNLLPFCVFSLWPCVTTMHQHNSDELTLISCQSIRWERGGFFLSNSHALDGITVCANVHDICVCTNSAV